MYVIVHRIASGIRIVYPVIEMYVGPHMFFVWCISPIINTCIWLKALFGMHVKLKHNEHTFKNTSTETHTTLFHIIKSLFFYKYTNIIRQHHTLT